MLKWGRCSSQQLLKKSKIIQKQYDQAEKNQDIIQDAIALDQDIEYQQQAMQDLMDQQKAKMQEGLDEEFDNLGKDELMDAMKDYNNNKQTTTQTNTAQTQKTAKKDTTYDDMMKDLLS